MKTRSPASTGIYYADRKMLHFRDSVKIVNPDFVMRADTMRYDTYNEIVWFEGPTEAVGDSIYLFCEKGGADTRKDVSQLMKNAVLTTVSSVSQATHSGMMRIRDRVKASATLQLLTQRIMSFAEEVMPGT
ncbi:MAG: hypothetical protein MZV63_45220 [Marinilabiliales bacterium]|nr:hypothetical protein [Marinilabiliales bacterium]